MRSILCVLMASESYTKNPVVSAASVWSEVSCWLTGMQKLVAATPALAARPEFQRILNLKGLDVIATRCTQLLPAGPCNAIGSAIGRVR